MPRRTRTSQTWLAVHSLPLERCFCPSCGSFWNSVSSWSDAGIRYVPQDRAARLFFAMCIVTVGGVCGRLPLVADRRQSLADRSVHGLRDACAGGHTPHFFLVYPHEKLPLLHSPRSACLCCTGSRWCRLACGCVARHVFFMGSTADLPCAGTDCTHPAGSGMAARRHLLLPRGGGGVLPHHTRGPGSQLPREPSSTASSESGFSGPAFLRRSPRVHPYLAHFLSRRDLCWGTPVCRCSPPVCRSCWLMPVGIVRYRLMLVDQMLSRGMSYYAVSFTATVVYSLAIASSSLLDVSEYAGRSGGRRHGHGHDHRSAAGRAGSGTGCSRSSIAASFVKNTS